MEVWQNRLTRGYQEFRAGDFHDQKDLYERLGTEGQNPNIMLIGCADSRVDPTDIFNAYPGEMFVARNVANIVPPFEKSEGLYSTLAAIEYAVTVIKVDVIVVMGHESCGGVAGCLAGMGDEENASYVGKWVSLLNGARDKLLPTLDAGANVQFEMELEGIRQSLRNLMTYPFIQEAVEAGRLSLQGAYFGIASANLLMSDEDGKFLEVAEKSE